MVAVSAVIPVTMPALPTATAVLVVLHTPPVVASVSVAAIPVYKTELPLIAAGNGVTVSVRITVQPVPSE